MCAVKTNKGNQAPIARGRLNQFMSGVAVRHEKQVSVFPSLMIQVSGHF